MKTLSPGKFEIELGGKRKIIIVSLGLKTEIYKLITSAQLEMAAIGDRVYMDAGMAQAIKDKDAELKLMRDAEEAEDKVEAAQEELDDLYTKALADIEIRQTKAFNETLIQKIDMSERVMAEAISCLLSERDDQGRITEKIEPNVIMWSPEYAEAQEELTDLLHAVTEYITSALKKISGISRMVQETTDAASPKTNQKA